MSCAREKEVLIDELVDKLLLVGRFAIPDMIVRVVTKGCLYNVLRV